MRSYTTYEITLVDRDGDPSVYTIRAYGRGVRGAVERSYFLREGTFPVVVTGKTCDYSIYDRQGNYLGNVIKV